MKNFTHLFFVLMVLFSSKNTSAQYTLDWEHNANQDSKKSVMSAIDTQDNVVVAGYLQSYRMYTRKYDIAGTLL